MMKNKHFTLAGLLLAAALPLSGACSSLPAPAIQPSGEPHLTTGKAITGGQVYPSDAPSWIAYIKTKAGSCTGQFITPSLAMTARHCVFHNGDYDLADSVTVYWAGSDAGALTPEAGIPVQEIIRWVKTKDEQEKDVVLLKLTEPYPAGVKAVTSAPLFHGYALRPEAYTLPMGYGVQEGDERKLKWATMTDQGIARDVYGGEALFSKRELKAALPAGYPPGGSSAGGGGTQAGQ